MPLVVLVVLAGAAGTCVWVSARVATRRWGGPAPTVAASRAIREHDPGLVRSFVQSRFDAEVLTGLALTAALVVIILLGLVVAALAVLVHHSEALTDLDSSAAREAHRYVGPETRRVLEDITWLASTQGVIVIGVVVGVIEWIRLPNRWIPVFLVVVTLGDSLVTNTIKGIVERARPTIEPVAATLGPSFPSGHSSTAAAFFAALALLAGRRRSAARAALAGIAVGLAVAVACSRVLLDLHWVSDVVAGLALGWGWFAVCALAFGGALMRLGAPLEAAARGEAGASIRLASADDRPGGKQSARSFPECETVNERPALRAVRQCVHSGPGAMTTGGASTASDTPRRAPSAYGRPGRFSCPRRDRASCLRIPKRTHLAATKRGDRRSSRKRSRPGCDRWVGRGQLVELAGRGQHALVQRHESVGFVAWLRAVDRYTGPAAVQLDDPERVVERWPGAEAPIHPRALDAG